MSLVSVFGLGYVGNVSAACLAKAGHDVIGVDVNPNKVDLIQAGKPTVVEAGLEELVRCAVSTGKLQATTEAVLAIQKSDVSLVCVGTPPNGNGSLDLTIVERVCHQIGSALRNHPKKHTVVIRSTVLPGSTDEVMIPTLERASGRRVGEDLSVCVNPEFLREGSSVKDFHSPPFTLIGANDESSAAAVAALYNSIDATTHVTTLRTAEMVKYVCNGFHAVKIGFANEIGNLCKALDVDSHEVMRIFCEDRKLNISPAYLQPGFAFGGSCLPKDLRALVYKARRLDFDPPILSAALESNRKQIDRAYDMVMANGRKRVGVLGLSFKAGTDDLRESPMVALTERLIGKGLQVLIYDRYVSQAHVVGANREFIEREIPHIWSLMRPSIEQVLGDSDVVVVGNRTPEFGRISAQLRKDQVVIDLVRAFDGARSGGTYEGICW